MNPHDSAFDLKRWGSCSYVAVSDIDRPKAATFRIQNVTVMWSQLILKPGGCGTCCAAARLLCEFLPLRQADLYKPDLQEALWLILQIYISGPETHLTRQASTYSKSSPWRPKADLRGAACLSCAYNAQDSTTHVSLCGLVITALESELFMYRPVASVHKAAETFTHTCAAQKL